jgi:DNA-binding response OmpR family regulator
MNLSPKEYAFLEFLMCNKGIVQERPRLLDHVWRHGDSDNNATHEQSITVYATASRKKPAQLHIYACRRRL